MIRSAALMLCYSLYCERGIERKEGMTVIYFVIQSIWPHSQT